MLLFWPLSMQELQLFVPLQMSSYSFKENYKFLVLVYMLIFFNVYNPRKSIFWLLAKWEKCGSLRLETQGRYLHDFTLRRAFMNRIQNSAYAFFHYLTWQNKYQLICLLNCNWSIVYLQHYSGKNSLESGKVSVFLYENKYIYI